MIEFSLSNDFVVEFTSVVRSAKSRLYKYIKKNEIIMTSITKYINIIVLHSENAPSEGYLILRNADIPMFLDNTILQ